MLKSRYMHPRKHLLAVLVGLMAFFTIPATASANNWPIVGWWPLDEGRGQTVYDWSGNRQNGQLGDTPGVDSHDPSWIRGRWWGSALSFGGDDFIRIPSTRALEVQQLTVSLWFRGTGSPGTYKYLMAKGGDGCKAASYGLETGWNGGLWFYAWDGQFQHGSGIADPTVWDGRWHHAAGTWDGTLSKLFIDGKLIGEGSSSPGTIDYGLPQEESTLGGYRGTCDLLFTGDLDNVKVWNQPLPMSDIWRRFSSLLGSPTIQ